jgi:uncharacterized repeat protein (TIGR02543 family)
MYKFDIQLFAGETVTVGSTTTEPTTYEDYAFENQDDGQGAEIYLVSYTSTTATLAVYADSALLENTPTVGLETSGAVLLDSDTFTDGDWYSVSVTGLSGETQYKVYSSAEYDGETVKPIITFTTDAGQSTWTVTYDSNGGSAVASEEDIEDDGLATEPTAPTRLNYAFAGWFTDDDTFANEWDFTTDTVTEDTTLYAKWTQSVENKFTQWGRVVHTLIKAPTSEQKDANYTLALTDAGKVILAGHATNSVKITIPTNSSVAFPTNTEIAVVRYKEGDVTIGTSSGATLNGEASTTTFDLGDRYTSVAIKKVGTDAWIMTGNFEESA